MRRERRFSISEFARLTGTTRAILLNYDKIGLLSPNRRGIENKYRYYSIGQVGVMSMIHTLKSLGMGLKDIAALQDNRTPNSIKVVLKNQISVIEGKIEQWIMAKKLLNTLSSVIDEASDIDEQIISIKTLPPKAIILGGINDYTNGKDDYDALVAFYENLIKTQPNVNLNYPVGGIFKNETVENRDWLHPDRYYMIYPEGEDVRAAAEYAIGYSRCAYGNSDTLYQRILEYIAISNYEICGNIYAEYPLNEVCVTDENNYLLRLVIAVRKKHRIF